MNRLVIFLLIVIAPAVVNAQKVKVRTDPGIDFQKFKTYAWSHGVPAANPLIGQLIIQAIEQALTANGLTKVNADADPDMNVVVWAALDSSLHISQPTWGRSVTSATATGIPLGAQSAQIPEGTLVVAISDARTKNSVWHATASTTLNYSPTGDLSKDAQRADKQIQKVVTKMFKKYPSRAGKK